MPDNLLVRCPCGARFDALVTPLPLAKAVAVLAGLVCPGCGEREKLLVGPPDVDPIMAKCSGCGRAFPRNELLEDFRRDLWCDACDGYREA